MQTRASDLVGEDDVLAEFRRAQPWVGPEVMRCGIWLVTEEGLAVSCAPLVIPKEHLRETYWIRALLREPWIDVRRGDLDDYLDSMTEAIAYHFLAKQVPRTDSVNVRKRFLVLKRDGYRCQICGRSAQDNVILHVDHKVPKAKGGTNEMRNLWTLCQDCNLGKMTEDL